MNLAGVFTPAKPVLRRPESTTLTWAESVYFCK